MDKKKTYLKVGITVVITIIILLYGLAFLKEFKLDLNENVITVYFQNVNGLKEGDQVGVNGVPKGKVRNIALEGDSVKVEFLISKDVVLKKDYRIQVAMIELMSGKQISINPGRSTELADISRPLIGDKSKDIVSLIETLSEVGELVKEIGTKLNETTDNLNKTVNNVNELMGDENLKSNIKSTASNFNTASKNFNLLLVENRSSLSLLTDKLHSIADNFDQTISENRPELKATIQDIRDLTTKLDTLTFNINQLVVDTKDSNSTVGKLIANDEFYTNLNKTVLNIDKLIKKINKDGIKLRLF